MTGCLREYILHCRLFLVKFSYLCKLHVIIALAAEIWLFWFIRDLARNLEIRNNSTWVLCNIWRLGRFGIPNLAWLHYTKNHISFSQMFWKDDLSKKIGLEYDISCIIRKDDFFLTKIYYSLGGRWKMIFLKKYMEIWCFLYVHEGGISFSYKYEIILLSKTQRWSFPARYT